jgi:hypothetical protein
MQKNNWFSLRSKKGLALAIGLTAVVIPSVVWATVTVPHSFTANTPAKASEVNDNFTALATAMNKTTTIVHVTDANNTPHGITTNYTCIDNPATNNDPTATLFVTRVLGGANSTDIVALPGVAVGVFYNTPTSKWCIQRMDNGQMPYPATTSDQKGIGFNVLVIKP